MSGNYPSTPYFKTLSLTSAQPTLISKAHSGKRQVRQIAGHSWKITAKYDGMTRSEFMPVYAFAMKQKGQYEAFQIILPDLKDPFGVASGTAKVNGAVSSGNTIRIDGLQAATSDVFKAGDIIKGAGHNKVYMIVEDAVSGTGNILLETGDYLLLETGDKFLKEEYGQVTVTVEPALIEPLADNEGITYNNVPFTVQFAGDIQQYGAAAPAEYVFEIDLIEVTN